MKNKIKLGLMVFAMFFCSSKSTFAQQAIQINFSGIEFSDKSIGEDDKKLMEENLLVLLKSQALNTNRFEVNKNSTSTNELKAKIFKMNELKAETLGVEMFQVELIYVSEKKNYKNVMLCKGQTMLKKTLEKPNDFSSKFYEDFFKNI